MSSLRKLRRRALRWQRYVSRYTPPHDYFERPEIKEPPGYWLAFSDVGAEVYRRTFGRWADDEDPF